MGVVGEARRRLLFKMSALEEGSSGGLARKKPEMMSKMLRQIGASVFFGVSSVLIITVNKTVLTTYKLVAYATCLAVQLVHERMSSNKRTHTSHSALLMNSNEPFGCQGGS